MKYRVILRLLHPEYLPSTTRVLVEAHSHRELEAGLAKVTAKWRAQGYHAHVLSVIPLRLPERREL
ncbi:MAG: hypothetical protein J2P37_18015 [Ktedonobacteraceae bacterium]|nr:hypothetical protein [Ktedonobacteraceae bacterium]MBO0790740.1 hypothetical protein [Ktedonobacteraceae bacterium]